MAATRAATTSPLPATAGRGDVSAEAARTRRRTPAGRWRCAPSPCPTRHGAAGAGRDGGDVRRDRTVTSTAIATAIPGQRSRGGAADTSRRGRARGRFTTPIGPCRTARPRRCRRPGRHRWRPRSMRRRRSPSACGSGRVAPLPLRRGRPANLPPSTARRRPRSRWRRRGRDGHGRHRGRWPARSVALRARSPWRSGSTAAAPSPDPRGRRIRASSVFRGSPGERTLRAPA